MKKKVIIAIPVILILGYFTVLAVLTYNAKSKYDTFAEQYSQLSIVELTPKKEKEILDDISGMTSRGTVDPATQNEKKILHQELGLSYDTQGFVDLVTFNPPPFDLFDMEKNKLNAQKMILMGIFSPMASANKHIYVKSNTTGIQKAFIGMLDGKSYLEIKNDDDGVYTEVLHYTPTEENEVDPDGVVNSVTAPPTLRD
ncbi:hypothetical protein [Coraliomargarita parva]|uniref:hypothetical protein n=1 Tax=Coraliomargarita parva TaxID=3014050 RepID=UPI0022B58539|nr:hypothetical protein [Coraliomargarita parva]